MILRLMLPSTDNWKKLDYLERLFQDDLHKHTKQFLNGVVDLLTNPSRKVFRVIPGRDDGLVQFYHACCRNYDLIEQIVKNETAREEAMDSSEIRSLKGLSALVNLCETNDREFVKDYAEVTP